MTSKNILFIGGLLFALLVTSCVAYFLERFNPLIHTIKYTTHEKNEYTPVIILPEPNTTVTLPVEENRSLSLPAEQKEIPTEKPLTPKVPGINESLPKTSQPAAAKKDHKIVPQKRKHHNTAQLHTKKEKEITAHRHSKGIVIEPVLLTRTLHPSPGGLLYRNDKSLLRDIAQRIRHKGDLYLLLSTFGITPKKRSYMQRLRAYLLQKGVKPQQIKVEIKRASPNKKYIFSDQNKDKIELSILERM